MVLVSAVGKHNTGVSSKFDAELCIKHIILPSVRGARVMMCTEGYSIQLFCVSVCSHASCYIPRL